MEAIRFAYSHATAIARREGVTDHRGDGIRACDDDH
jgi:hypothetical protein